MTDQVPNKFPLELVEVVDGLERQIAEFRRLRDKMDQKVSKEDAKSGPERDREA